MSVIPAVTAVLLHHSSLDISTEFSVVITGKLGNIGYA